MNSVPLKTVSVEHYMTGCGKVSHSHSRPWPASTTNSRVPPIFTHFSHGNSRLVLLLHTAVRRAAHSGLCRSTWGAWTWQSYRRIPAHHLTLFKQPSCPCLNWPATQAGQAVWLARITFIKEQRNKPTKWLFFAQSSKEPASRRWRGHSLGN